MQRSVLPCALLAILNLHGCGDDPQQWQQNNEQTQVLLAASSDEAGPCTPPEKASKLKAIWKKVRKTVGKPAPKTEEEAYFACVFDELSKLELIGKKLQHSVQKGVAAETISERLEKLDAKIRLTAAVPEHLQEMEQYAATQDLADGMLGYLEQTRAYLKDDKYLIAVKSGELSGLEQDMIFLQNGIGKDITSEAASKELEELDGQVRQIVDAPKNLTRRKEWKAIQERVDSMLGYLEKLRKALREQREPAPEPVEANELVLPSQNKVRRATTASLP